MLLPPSLQCGNKPEISGRPRLWCLMGPAAGPSLHPLCFCDCGCEASGSRRLLEQLFSDSSAAPRLDHTLRYKLLCVRCEGCKPQRFFSLSKPARPEMKPSLFCVHLTPPCFLSFSFLFFPFFFFKLPFYFTPTGRGGHK